MEITFQMFLSVLGILGGALTMLFAISKFSDSKESKIAKRVAKEVEDKKSLDENWTETRKLMGELGQLKTTLDNVESLLEVLVSNRTVISSLELVKTEGILYVLENLANNGDRVAEEHLNSIKEHKMTLLKTNMNINKEVHPHENKTN